MTGWLSPSGVLTTCEPAYKLHAVCQITRCDDESRALLMADAAGWLWIESALTTTGRKGTDAQERVLRAERKRLRGGKR